MSNSWTATYTPTSAHSGRLNVNGNVLSVDGETFTLQIHGSQESKPGILVLDKVGIPSQAKIHNDLARTIPVTYEEEIRHQSYSRVLILPDEISVPVEHVATASLL